MVTAVIITTQPISLDMESDSPKNSHPDTTLAMGSNIQKMAAVVDPKLFIPSCKSTTANREVQMATTNVRANAAGLSLKTISCVGTLYNSIAKDMNNAI